LNYNKYLTMQVGRNSVALVLFVVFL